MKKHTTQWQAADMAWGKPEAGGLGPTLVRRRCAELGLSMQGLANRAGISRSHLYALLSGQTRDPGVRTLARIAHALALSPVALYRHYAGMAVDDQAAMPTTLVYGDADAQDAIAFCADVTVPDHSLVLPGERFTKTWLVQNVGQHFWRGRDLVCATDEYVILRHQPDGRTQPLLRPHLRSAQPWMRVADTPLGGLCELSMEFVAPQENCSVASIWRMRDAQGQYCYGDRFFLQVIVTVLGI